MANAPQSQTGEVEHELKSDLNEKQRNDGHTIPAIAKYQLAEGRIPSSKEALSAYFTIAAAAFGLISDGCE